MYECQVRVASTRVLCFMMKIAIAEKIVKGFFKGSQLAKNEKVDS